MKRLGQLLHGFTPVIVARCDEEAEPQLDSVVVDSSLNRIGKIVDVIGPVERPYVVVEKNEKGGTDIERGAKLYIRD